jgi:DNA-binding transcriptional LysR family regulator
VSITLEERRSADVVRGIEDGEADIGISRAFVPARGLACHPHRFDHFGVAMDATHPLAGQGSLAFKDTLRFERIGMSLDPANHASLQTLMVQAAAEHGQELFYRVQVTNYDAALRLLGGSLALAILPMQAAHHRASALGLRMVPLSDAWARQQFTVCVRAADPLSPAAHKVLAHLLARAAQSMEPAEGLLGS